MAPPPPFAVEQWMDKYETTAKYNIAESCSASISLDELLSLSEDRSATLKDILDTAAIQDYGEIRGSNALRTNLSRLYSAKVATPLPIEQILITPGAISANHLVLYSLVKPGDHVICQYPTYQQLYSIPESLGAEVDLWKCRPEKNWLPDFEELKGLIKENTKLIIINNPQNPTGAILPKPLLQQILDLCITHSDITLLSDEVYRPLFHGISPMDANFPPSALSLLPTPPSSLDPSDPASSAAVVAPAIPRVIVTGSCSKAYSLAGIRVGWIATRSPELLEQCAATRDYTTISVSRLDMSVAAFALAPHTIHALLGRNVALARTNLELLDRWIIKHEEYCEWVKPAAGTTAFVKFTREAEEGAGEGGRRMAVDAKVLCVRVQAETGVMMLPGDVGFGEEWRGYVRIGYVCRTEVLKGALEELRKWMRKEFDDVPLCED